MKTTWSHAYLCLFLSILVPSASAQAWRDSEDLLFSGVVETGGAPADGLIVVLSSQYATDRRTDVGVSGDFRFFDVPRGDYQLSVNTRSGDVLHRQRVSLSPPQAHLLIEIRDQSPKLRDSSPGTISLAKLLHKIPSNAQKEFRKAMKAADKGDSQSAIGYLERAIELDPMFVAAINNLGVQQLRAGNNETARSYFQSAVDLDPAAPEPATNLARVLDGLHRFPEAEVIARKAVRLAGTRSAPHFYLALALLGQEKSTTEALHHLRLAKVEIANARLAIAMVLEDTGDNQGAKEELRAFLREAPPRARKIAIEQLSDLWKTAGAPLDGSAAQGR